MVRIIAPDIMSRFRSTDLLRVRIRDFNAEGEFGRARRDAELLARRSGTFEDKMEQAVATYLYGDTWEPNELLDQAKQLSPSHFSKLRLETSDWQRSWPLPQGLPELV
ncbi:MAG: hypothetical protein EOQ41_03030 [Mesorhizobium sp.]|uniref:hypothetical protein n=1 Tax=Mesorhizobium sp. TaxID=1871066 RepID=UPI000FEA488F|nr:hypothetical protein [Mesorhizobium sp.]RWB35799.1 MAG: hypothetical protein EOQ41_03030 [Mesorhizobium sp.]